MVFGRLQPKRKKSKENDLKSSDRVTSQKELPPIWRLQQSIGNQASTQLLEAATPSAPLTEAIQGLAIRMQHKAALFATKAIEEGEQKLWRTFEKLTIGQRQALFNEWFDEGRSADFPSWNKFSADIEKMKEVPLQADEPYQEGNIAELGASIPPYLWKTTGLLAPYKEIWLWLGYKGNKQGKPDVLQKLDSLTIEQKQLLLHRIVGKKRLSLYQISEQLTIEKNLKQWVDWSRIEQMLQSITSLSKKQVEQQLELIQSEELDDPIELEQLDAEDSSADSDDDFSALLSLFMLDSADEEETKLTLEQRFEKPEEMYQLLFGESIHNVKTPVTLGTKDQLIDRALDIDAKLSVQNQERIRKQKLKEQGYSSGDQLFVKLKLLLIEQLFQQGVLGKNEMMVMILRKLNVLRGKQKVNKDQVAARIHSI